MSATPVSLKHIAIRCGVSEMTVSRVLRNQPNVKLETRNRILKTALKLGYRPDPQLQRLRHYLRASRKRRMSGILALVWIDVPHRDFDKQSINAKYLLRYVRGGEEQARLLGYKLEQFWLTEPGMSGRRLEQILVARGIRGVVIAPQVYRPRSPLRMDWRKFCLVQMGEAGDLPMFHRVVVNDFSVMKVALASLTKNGYRRIGLFVDRYFEDLYDHRWSAAFITHHPLGPEQALELLKLSSSRNLNVVEFVHWWKQTQPDVVLLQGHVNPAWTGVLQEHGIDLRYAVLNLAPEHRAEKLAGVEQYYELCAAHAVDLVTSLLQSNERGVPPHPRTVHPDLAWVDGESA